MTSDRIAKEDYVDAAVAGIVDTAPGTLDTLNELAAALGDDANFATTVTTALAGKQPLDSDLTALAALTTTSYGRAFLELANAAAALVALGLDPDLGTFSLPGSTTISAFGASLIDDAAASNARTTLGLGTAATNATGDFQPIDSDLTALAALTTTSFGRGLLELANAAAAIAALGLDADLATLSLPASTTISAFGASLIDDAAASNARTTLGLGTAAVNNTGDFDAAGAATAAQAASQPLDADLTTIAGLTATTDNIIQSVAGAWASRTPSQVRTALALVIGTNVQAWDADLDAIAALSTTSFGRGLLALADAAALRTSAALGTIATQNANAVAVTGGTVTGITDLAVADGGTGASTAAAARTNLGVDTGWLADPNTWVYVSATSFKITGVDATGYLPKGTKISYNDGAVDYGHVAAVAFASGDTTVTLIPNTDYAIANATLTAPRYSYADNPQGFPTWFNWSPTLTGWSTNPTNTVYRYYCVGTAITIAIRQLTAGTSNNTQHTMTLPVAAVTITNMTWLSACPANDNGTNGVGDIRVASGGTTASLDGLIATTNNTASGASRLNSGNLTYEF